MRAVRSAISHLGTTAGRVAGWLGAPLFGLISFARRARTFHPRGVTYHASVHPSAGSTPELRGLAERLSGVALVRFSGALWKQERSFDVLGCAIRLRTDAAETARSAGDDQDLLFATIRRPWTMGLSPFTTDAHDYMGNDYFAVSPFEVGLGRPVYLRLRPAAVGHRDRPRTARERPDGRDARLARAVERGDARFRIDLARGPFGPWTPLVALSLERAAKVDDEALRFSPFRAGRGVRPCGFVHGLRAGAYAASQWARPRSTPPHDLTANVRAMRPGAASRSNGHAFAGRAR